MKNEKATASVLNARKQVVISSPKKKPVVIAIISVAILAVLVLFLFFGSRFVGRAIYTEVAEPLVSVEGNVVAGSPVTLVVGANIANTMTGASFQLTLSSGDICTGTIRDVFGGLLAGSSLSYSCTDGILRFDDGQLARTLPGPTVDLLEVTLTPSTVPLQLTFLQFQVIDGNNQYGFSTVRSFTCEDTSCTTGIAPAVLCGNDDIDPGEDCDGTNLGGTTCGLVIEGTTGALSCTSSCRFDTQDCVLPEPPGSDVCTEAQCRDDFGLITSGECPTDGTDGECPSLDGTAVANFCAMNPVVCQQMCSTLSLCPSTGALSVDLNGDGVVGNDELFIIKLALFAKDSEPQPNCGAQGQPFCYFRDQGYYICENLEFIQVRTGTEAPASGQVCGGPEYITGGT